MGFAATLPQFSEWTLLIVLIYDNCCHSVEIVLTVMTNNAIDLLKNNRKGNFIFYSVCSYNTFTKLWQSSNVPLCRVPCFHASRECVEALNRYCGSSLS